MTRHKPVGRLVLDARSRCRVGSLRRRKEENNDLACSYGNNCRICFAEGMRTVMIGISGSGVVFPGNPMEAGFPDPNRRFGRSVSALALVSA